MMLVIRLPNAYRCFSDSQDMPDKVDALKAPVETGKMQQPGSDASAPSPYSSTYSSDTDDIPVRGLSRGQGLPMKMVADLKIREEEEPSSLDGTSIDELPTAETSRRTSFEDRLANGSPKNSRPAASMFIFSAPSKSLQHAEQAEQRLKLARLLLARSKVCITLFNVGSLSSCHGVNELVN
jgi:hypothetical protein